MSKIVSIIIAVNKDDRLERCLISLAKQNYNKEKFEILIIENGSPSIFKSLALKYNARYFYLPDKNMAQARNIGLKNALGKYVLFTDSDCVCDKSWIEKMVLCLSNNSHAGVGGIIERYSPKTKIEKFGKNLAWGQRELQYLQILNLPYVVFANAGFVREALIEVGGFDIELLSGNDVDICWKLGLKKYKLNICQSAVVFHENRKTIKDYFNAYFRYGKYQSLLFKKYQSITGKNFMINTYAIKLFFNGLFRAICLIKGNFRPWYDIVESTALIVGHIYGSICFRVIYV